MPVFGGENKSGLFQDFVLLPAVLRGSRALSKRAPNTGPHQTPVETLSDVRSKTMEASHVPACWENKAK